MNNPLFDVLFNTEDWLEDNIKATKLVIEILEDTKQVMIHNQSKILDLSMDIKSKEIRDVLRKQQEEGFIELLKLDQQIDKNKKVLKDWKEMKRKIL